MMNRSRPLLEAVVLLLSIYVFAGCELRTQVESPSGDEGLPPGELKASLTLEDKVVRLSSVRGRDEVELQYQSGDGSTATSCQVSNPSLGILGPCECQDGRCFVKFTADKDLLAGFQKRGGFDAQVFNHAHQLSSRIARVTLSNEYPQENLGDLQIPASRLEDWSSAGVPGGVPDTTGWPTINVVDFGANPNCSPEPTTWYENPDPNASIIDYYKSCYYKEQSDIIAINNAISSASPGTVVLIPPGCYEAWFVGDIATRVASSEPGIDMPDGKRYRDINGDGVINRADGDRYGACELPVIRMKSGVVVKGTGSSPSDVKIISNRKTDGFIQFSDNYQRLDWPVDTTKFHPARINGDCDHISLQPAFPTRRGAGLENIKIQWTARIVEAPGYYPMIKFFKAAGHWIRGIEAEFGDNAVLDLTMSSHNTIQGSTFRLTKFNAPTSQGGTNQEYNSHLLGLAQGSSENLIVDNLFEDNEQQIKVECSANRNVIAHNYFRRTKGTWKIALMFHGGYTFQNLIESNKVEGSMMADDWWGMNGPNTLFRNELTGTSSTDPTASITSHNNLTQSTDPLAAEGMNYLLNVTNQLHSAPYCDINSCRSFFPDQRDTWSEMNRVLLLSVPYFGSGGPGKNNTLVGETLLCSSSYPAGCQGFFASKLKISDCNPSNDPNCHKLTGYDARFVPSTWLNRVLPKSLYWFRSNPPPYWCQESPWPALGADLYNGSTPSTLLPSERRAKDLPCTVK